MYTIFVVAVFYLPHTGTIITIWGDIDSMVNLLSYNVSAIVAIAKYIVLYKQRHGKLFKIIMHIEKKILLPKLVFLAQEFFF